MKTKTIKLIVLVLFVMSVGIVRVSARSLPPSTPIEMDEGGSTNIQNERIVAPTGVIASDGTYTDHINVCWNTVSGATYYQLYRHTENISSSSGLINSGPGICNNDYSAAAGTYYYYWAKACDSVGCSDYSSPDQGWRNFEAPVNVSATNGTYTDKVQITWNAVSGITYYEIYRNTSPDSGGAIKNPSNPTTNSFDDTTANPGMQYYYWVKACANILCSAYSSVDAGYRAITPPTGVTATDGSFTDRVNVSWAPAAGAGYYEVWRSLTDSSGSAAKIPIAPPPSVSPYNDGSAQPGTQYFYWVKACSTATSCSDFSLSDPGYRAITAPTGVAATDGTYTDKVQVSWNFVTGATFYEVRRFQSNNPGSAELIASPPTSPYDDTTATPGIQYYYWIKGCSTTTPCSDFSLSNSGYRAITAPTGVFATDGTYLDRVTISWSTSTGATSYQIWRNTTDNSGTATLVGTSTTSPTNDTSAVAGTLYYYWVIGCSETRCSAYSTSNSGYRALTPPTAVSATDGSYTDKIAISWNPSTGATYYEVWHSATSNPATAALLSSPSSGPYNDIATTPGVLHYYWLKACGTAGCSGFSASDTGYRAITAPTGVNATDGTYIDRVDISWSASTGATFYEIHRNFTDSSGTASLLGSPTTSPYSDTTAIPGTQYYYWVKGCSTTPCSAYSASNSGWRAINAPTGVSASDGTYNDRVEVTWTNSTGATSYKIMRHTSDNPGGATMISGGTTSPYNDTTAIAGTLFYYWAQGCNSLGCSPLSSSDSGYRAITAPTGVSASDGTYTDKVVLSWNYSSGATYYQIWRNTADNSGGATQIPGSYTANTFDDTSAALGSLYYYWIKGCNNEIGCSAFSSSDPGYAAITAPTGVLATKGTFTDKVQILWNPAAGATLYEVWRNTTDFLGTSTKLTSSQATSPYDDSSASAGILFYYWVRGCNIFGCSDFSSSDNGYAAITPPTGVLASNGTYTDKVVISWNPSDGATYYQIWRNTTDNSGGATQIPGSFTANTFDDITTAPGSLYYYWIKGCNNEIGCSAFSSSNPGYRAILPPSTLSASDGTNSGGVEIAWTNAVGSTYFELWRNTVDLTTGSQLMTSQVSRGFFDTTATPGVLYYYWVKGCSAIVCSDYSLTETGYRSLPAVTGLSASDGSSTEMVEITWIGSIYETYYEVWRSETSLIGDASRIADDYHMILYGDFSATPGFRYYYWVRACNDIGCSNWPVSNSGWRVITPPTGVDASDGTYTDKVVISWNPSDGATYYKIWAIADALPEPTLIATPSTSPYEDLLPPPGVIYDYWVEGCTTDTGCSDVSGSDTGFRMISPPPSVSASNGTYTDKVQISWGETANASYYEVWRGNATRSTLVKLPGEPTASPYDDTSADPGVLYDYQVLACNMETGCSAYSDSATGYRAILAPTSISASDGTFTEKVEVQWDPANGATYYELWRSLENYLTTANYLGEANGSSGDDTTAVAGMLYYYWVKGCSPIVCSSFSDSDSGYRGIAMEHKVFLPLIIR